MNRLCSHGHGRQVRRLWLALLVVVLTACGNRSSPADRVDGTESSPTRAGGTPELPAYCATVGGADAGFWRLVEKSCRLATDGDARQARALRRVLSPLPAAQVAAFHRTFVRVNHALDTRRIGSVADRLCAPRLGLGDDLFTDFRSWVIAHGQAAVDAVRKDPGVEP